MEKDKEISDGTQDFGARKYDSRIGRWLSVDPLAAKYTSMSPYTGIGNNPIIYVDTDGRQITPRISYDKNNKPIITIVITGKVIDYTGHNNPNITSRINAFASKQLWVGDSGLFGATSVDVSGLTFQDAQGNDVQFEEAQVNFEFHFEEVTSITQVAPDDHVIALVPNFSILNRSKLLPPETEASGVTGGRGSVAFIDYYTFTGLKDWSHGYGEAVTAHEIITHMMGLSHTYDEYGKVTYGNGVYCYSDRVTRDEARTILKHLTSTPQRINQGDNTATTIDRTIKVPNGATGVKEIPSVRGYGVDVKTIYQHEKKQQGG